MDTPPRQLFGTVRILLTFWGSDDFAGLTVSFLFFLVNSTSPCPAFAAAPLVQLVRGGFPSQQSVEPRCQTQRESDYAAQRARLLDEKKCRK